MTKTVCTWTKRQHFAHPARWPYLEYTDSWMVREWWRCKHHMASIRSVQTSAIGCTECGGVTPLESDDVASIDDFSDNQTRFVRKEPFPLQSLVSGIHREWTLIRDIGPAENVLIQKVLGYFWRSICERFTDWTKQKAPQIELDDPNWASKKERVHQIMPNYRATCGFNGCKRFLWELLARGTRSTTSDCRIAVGKMIGRRVFLLNKLVLFLSVWPYDRCENRKRRRTTNGTAERYDGTIERYPRSPDKLAMIKNRVFDSKQQLCRPPVNS